MINGMAEKIEEMGEAAYGARGGADGTCPRV